MADDIVIFPVAGWTIKAAPENGVILLQLSFLSHELQKMEEADPGRNYILTIKQAEKLRDALDRSVQQMKIAGTPPIGGPIH